MVRPPRSTRPQRQWARVRCEIADPAAPPTGRLGGADWCRPLACCNRKRLAGRRTEVEDRALRAPYRRQEWMHVGWNAALFQGLKFLADVKLALEARPRALTLSEKNLW